MNPAFQLKNFTTINQISHSINLEHNIAQFFDYGTLLISGYQNIYFNSTDYAGRPIGTLKPMESRQYSSGKVWEAYRTNWAWQSGSGINPVNISGIYINGVFTTSGFNVDYLHGQIVLDSGISTSSLVKCSYSPKTIFWDVSTSPWHRELLTETYKYSAFDASGIGSGIRNVLTNHRIQLPAVIVEVSKENNFEPYMLGGGSFYNPKVNFYIYAENQEHCKFITDLISSQNEHSFLGTDFEQVRQNNQFPYTHYGFLRSGAKTLPQLQAAYPWNVKPINFENLEGHNIPYTPGVYRALVTGNCNLVLLGV